jgi:CBS domain-containing protein
MKTCKDVMTANPTCCTPDETVTRIAKLMKTENVGSLLICDDRQTKNLLGIVTDRDLALEVIAAAKDPNTVKARDVMTRDPITCRPEDDLQVALDRMEAHQIRRIPVTDSNGRLVGIIAQADVARRVDDPEKVAELVEEVSKPSTAGAA